MIGPLVQMTALVSLTHAFRFLAKCVGPRRSGLLMGLPSTTAFVLVGCGLERGIDEATGAAEACLPGLVAAATVPVAFGRMTAAGWGLIPATLAAALGYVVVALSCWWVPGMGVHGSAAFAVFGLLTACKLAARNRPRVPEASPGRQARGPLPGWCVLAYRTAVPAAYVLALTALRAAVGAGWAQRFITFPGMSLAVLAATYIESGPTIARKLAAAMPAGSLGMLAFLTTFRLGCPQVGLGCGTFLGYLAALGVLLTVDWVTQSRPSFRLGDVFPLRPVRPSRQFSPRLEAVGG